VTGTVYLTVSTPVVANSVVVRCLGKESTYWENRVVEHEGTGEEVNPRTTWVEHRGRREIYAEKLVLSSYPQAIGFGSYQFPFRWRLPEGLPGSFDLVRSFPPPLAQRRPYSIALPIQSP
jgi:hypothetical protein